MKTAMAMLALVLGLSFGSATFVQADEMKKEAAPAAAASDCQSSRQARERRAL